MNLKNLINYILYEEESDPKLVAIKLTNKIKYFKNDGSEFKFVLNNLISEAKNNNGKIPIGNNKFINTNNKEELNYFVKEIFNNINTNNYQAKQTIKNALSEFINYFK